MRFLFAIFLFLIPGSAFMQQYPQLSMRFFDLALFNPAVTGSDKTPVVWIHHRSQWIGFDGAPVTEIAGYRHNKFYNMGFGGYLFNDVTGPTCRKGLSGIYAYHLKFKKIYLSLGVSGYLMNYRIRGDKVTLTEYSDNAVITEMNDNKWNGDLNSGFHLYNDHFYLGASVTQLAGTQYKLYRDALPEANIRLERHYYIMGGYHFQIWEEYDIAPSLLLGKTLYTPPQIDLNVKIEYMNIAIAGLSYRYKDAFVILAGVKISNQLTIAFSYDVVISGLANCSSGSCEFFSSFYIGGNKSDRRYRRHIKGREG